MSQLCLYNNVVCFLTFHNTVTIICTTELSRYPVRRHYVGHTIGYSKTSSDTRWGEGCCWKTLSLRSMVIRTFPSPGGSCDDNCDGGVVYRYCDGICDSDVFVQS